MKERKESRGRKEREEGERRERGGREERERRERGGREERERRERGGREERERRAEEGERGGGGGSRERGGKAGGKRERRESNSHSLLKPNQRTPQPFPPPSPKTPHPPNTTHKALLCDLATTYRLALGFILLHKQQLFKGRDYVYYMWGRLPSANHYKVCKGLRDWVTKETLNGVNEGCIHA